MFLTVVDMTDADGDPPADSMPEGVTIRSWYGVKLVSTITSFYYPAVVRPLAILVYKETSEGPSQCISICVTNCTT